MTHPRGIPNRPRNLGEHLARELDHAAKADELKFHQHSASCHGAIGELQCGLVDWRDESVMVLPHPQIPWHERNWMHVLRLVVYIVVLVTCVALLFSMWDLYQLVSDIQSAVNAWEDGITSPGLLGD